MTIAQRNTFLIDPQGKIVKVWTKVDLPPFRRGAGGVGGTEEVAEAYLKARGPGDGAAVACGGKVVH